MMKSFDHSFGYNLFDVNKMNTKHEQKRLFFLIEKHDKHNHCQEHTHTKSK